MVHKSAGFGDFYQCDFKIFEAFAMSHLILVLFVNFSKISTKKETPRSLLKIGSRRLSWRISSRSQHRLHIISLLNYIRYKL